MNAVEFLKERDRLTKMCSISCDECRLASNNCNSCFDAEEIVKIVEQWSKDCPKETYKSNLLKAFPNARLDDLCVDNIFGRSEIRCDSFNNCEDCWNQEYKGV